jgi:hypothetical protein
MKQVIYVAGCGHSGSTALGFMLGGHSKFVGVGEVFRLFDPKSSEHNWLKRSKELICSCKKTADQCELWGPVVERLNSTVTKNDTVAAQRQAYQVFLDVFYARFGEDFVPVDISKTDDGLSALAGIEGVSVKTIFLMRDVRSWTTSRRDANRRAGEVHMIELVKKYGLKFAKSYVAHTPSAYFWHWYFLNLRTQRLLKKNNPPYLQVGYEELMLNPELVMKKISEFLGVDFSERMLSLDDDTSHVLLGNRMRFDAEKRARVSYDSRWFYTTDWQTPSFLLPNIMQYNNREVYQNIRGHLWSK